MESSSEPLEVLEDEAEVTPFADEESDSDEISAASNIETDAFAHIPMENYAERKELYKNYLLRDDFKKHRHVALIRLIFLGDFNDEHFKEMRKKVKDHENNCDFLFIILIRELFLDQLPVTKRHRAKIEEIFSHFQFWPSTSNSSNTISKSIFWSENHIFMYLSTAHLVRQYSKERGLRCSVSKREEKLLIAYLEGHRDCAGIYEVLSHTYMPYTIAALLNLVDFSANSHIVYLATSLLEIMLTDLMLATTQKGICTLTASARTFPKYRHGLHGHNINQLILLLTGRGVDAPHPCHISQFFLTSNYVPPMTRIITEFTFTGYKAKRCNHRIRDIKSIYERMEELDKDDLIPFYWSAGLVAHPQFVNLTRKYRDKFKLQKNPHLKSLMYVPQSIAQYAMTLFGSYSEGQCYTDIDLHLYKERNLMLSSFERYNVGKCGFQQLPWMANINGIGVWSHSGVGNVLGFKITNSTCPCVVQRNNVLICAYIRSESMLPSISSMFSDSATYVTWPALLFDHVSYLPYENDDCFPVKETKYTKGSWWIGQSDDCYVGLTCTRSTELIKRSDDHFRVGGKDGRKVKLSKRKCSKPCHSWVCIVGTISRHATLADFSTYCHSAAIMESTKSVSGKQTYSATVQIDGQELILEHIY